MLPLVVNSYNLRVRLPRSIHTHEGLKHNCLPFFLQRIANPAEKQLLYFYDQPVAEDVRSGQVQYLIPQC